MRILLSYFFSMSYVIPVFVLYTDSGFFAFSPDILYTCVSLGTPRGSPDGLFFIWYSRGPPAARRMSPQGCNDV